MRAWLALMLFGLVGAPAWADTTHSVRLIGQAPEAKDPVPASFVLDLTLTQGDSPFQQDVSGWFAALPPGVGSAEVTGHCVRQVCAVDVDISGGPVSLSGDFTGAGGDGRFAVSDDEHKVIAEGAAHFAPVSGPIPVVGELAAPDAVSGDALRSLLNWNGVSDGEGPASDWPDDTDRDALATWQGSRDGGVATGLITVEDLKTLRAGAAAEQAAEGWTPIGDEAQGWSAGYPAKTLPNATQAGAERRFASADGKAVLVIAVDPPMSDEAFSALVDKVTADTPGQTSKNYSRINDDMTASYVEGGQAVYEIYHRREGGVIRARFSRPEKDDAAWSTFETVLPNSLVIKDTLKAP